MTPQWLHDSVRESRPLPCGDYAALKELHDPTEDNCPDCEEKSDSESTTAGAGEPWQPPDLPYQTSDKVKANYAARYACARASPLICINQDLVTELGVLQKSRELEGKGINALSYERAIAVRFISVRSLSINLTWPFSRLSNVSLNRLAPPVIINNIVDAAYPHAINPQNFAKEVQHLPYLGDKILSKVLLVFALFESP